MDLRNTRLAQIIEKVEQGESINWNREGLLLALDGARAAEVLLADAIDLNQEYDDKLGQLAGDA